MPEEHPTTEPRALDAPRPAHLGGSGEFGPRPGSELRGENRLSILIVSYETKELTLECLRSIEEHEPPFPYEVIVVDNASADGSAAAIARDFERVRLHSAPENLGFAAAVNLAAESARGAWLLLLNPDTVVLGDAVERIIAFAERHPEYGIFGGRTLFADGSLNPTSCWAKPTPWSAFCRGVGLSHLFEESGLLNPEAYGGWRRDTVREVDIVTGCFLVIRAQLWKELGGFDPSFFMYGEEADLCLRAARRGQRAVLCPEAEIIHHGGRSERIRAEKIIRLFRSKLLLVQRHWDERWRTFGRWMLVLWSVRQMVLWACLGPLRGSRGLEQARVHAEVWRRRREWLQPG